MVCAVAGKKVKVARPHSGGSNSCDSDDDFVAPPLPFVARVQEVPVSKSPAGDLTVDEDLAFPRVITRSPAGVLVDSLKDLSCQQKDDIREMGFASLLDFNVSECPPRLVYWLLSNFDAETRVFDLGGGRSLVLEERDVELVLGFPRGPIQMVKPDRLVISNLLKHWREAFLYVGVVYVSCLHAEWLLVDSLVETQAAWKSGSHKCFVGPAEFVALFYVDRVLHSPRPVPRVVPTCHGWSKELLQERELSEIRLGGFGRGVIELPLLNGGNVDSGGGHPQGSDVVTFDEFVTEKSAAMARDFLELSRVFKNATATELWVRRCKSSQPTFSQREDLFWSDAQNIRAVEDIQRAISERNEFMDMPSFSLGFTHEFNDGVRAVVDDIARDYGPVGDGMSHDMGVDMSHAIGEVGDDHAPGNMNASRGVDADCDSPVEGFCDENVGAGGGSGLTTSPVPPVVGGAETLLQVASPEVDLAARNSVPLVSTPLEIHTVVDASYDRDLRVGWFRERMAVDFESSPYKDYSEVDMLFFPIIREEHYFLIFFDFRRFRLEIIDNSASPKGKKDIYGDSLEDMQDMLQEFFAKTHLGKSTFTGQSFKHWDCGLVKGDFTMLHKLRLQYMKDLVLSEYNLYRDKNLARAYESINDPVV
nr:uncharacterized protein LOC109193148 isoform X2 [Ipomoea batatas]